MRVAGLLPRETIAVLLLLLALPALSSCGESDGTLVVYLSASPDLAEDPLDPSVVKWLRVRVEGPDMGVVLVEEPFVRGGSTRLPPVPAGERRRVVVEGLTGPEGLLVSRGESLPMTFSAGRNEVELYVGLIERFSSAAGEGLHPARRGCAIALSGDGLVLFVGGLVENSTGEEAMALVERFDPGAGALAGSLSCEGEEGCELARRWDHLAVAVDGGLFFSGGRNVQGSTPKAALCRQGECKETEDGLDRIGGLVAAHPEGGGYLLGGADVGEALTRVDYVDSAGTVREGVFELPVEGEGLSAAVYGRDGRGLLGMGFSDGKPRCFEGDPAGSGSFEVFEVPAVEDRRDAALVSLSDGRLLLVGGRNSAEQAIPEIAIFDPDLGTVCGAGSLIRPRWGHAAARLRDGRVIVTGGVTDTGQVTGEVEILDPRYLPEQTSCERVEGKLEVRSASKLAVARSGHVAVSLPNGMLLVAGGLDRQDEPVSRLEIFVPSY